jgi:hypothetical protein
VTIAIRPFEGWHARRIMVIWGRSQEKILKIRIL